MKKILIIVAALLIVIGGVLFTVALARSGFDFSKFAPYETETNTYTPEGDFQRISIQTKVSDIVLREAEDGKLSVLCTETEKARHTVSVENGTLSIIQGDSRDWKDYLTLFSPSLSVTVFLPSEAYESLTVSCGTGDIAVPSELTFGSADVSSSTGDVLFAASISGKLKITAATGSVTTEKLNVGEMDISVSTGKLSVTAVTCSGDVSLRVSTGKTALTDLRCRNLLSTGSTGDITLKNVIASEKIETERSTGDVRFDGCDAREITVKTSTGDITGSLLSPKAFTASSRTGSVSVPASQGSDPCRLTTTTGKINVSVASVSES